MKKLIVYSFILGGLTMLAAFTAGPAMADMYYEDRHFTVPEYLYYIEGTGSYYLPGQESDIFFNLGKWYRSQGGEWFIGDDQDGPWSGILTGSLPNGLAELPADFKTTRKLGMIPYRYIIGPEKQEEGYYRYYTRDYYEEFGLQGYNGRRHSYRTFGVFMAPGFDGGRWYYMHRKQRY